jgi:hypothetical protein
MPEVLLSTMTVVRVPTPRRRQHCWNAMLCPLSVGFSLISGVFCISTTRPPRFHLVMPKSGSRHCLVLSVLWTAFSATICAQSLPSRPEGVQLGDPANGLDITVSPSMTQCEPFLVYYNITSTSSPFIAFYRSDVLGHALLTLHPPAPAAGYIDWTCNIRAGHSLVVAVRSNGTLRGLDYIVRSGILSSCLTDVTTTYSLVAYGPEFRSFTSAGAGYFGSASYSYEHGYAIR